ncbi:MAG: DUF1819 family protein [Bacteroidaceae bacterium]|nr:DUF1819 family protein [Bacteroidaceae bacterium]
MNKPHSPYTAAITGGGFLYEETCILLPLLLSDNREELLRDEALNNRLLHINSETSRKRNIAEISRRYDTMPASFWTRFQSMDQDDQKVALFFVILKTYKICFDLHINVTMRKWNSISKKVEHDDLMMEFNEIAAKDQFVDSWSDATKKRVASAYLTILRKINMIRPDSSLTSIQCSNWRLYIELGEMWFLEASLLQPYQIENIKKELL